MLHDNVTRLIAVENWSTYMLIFTSVAKSLWIIFTFQEANDPKANLKENTERNKEKP